MSINAISRPRTFLITGATDGIGKHTSQRLASDGSHALLVHGRKSLSDAGIKSLIKDLNSLGAANVAYFQADLSNLKEVESLAEQVIAQLQSWQSIQSSDSSPIPSLDVLINNAGVYDPEPRYSSQGFDATMAINVLAPFVLTRKLLPSLIRGDDVRVITTSSISQSRTLPDLDSLFSRRLQDGKYYGNVEPLPYSAHSFYSYSKLGDFLFTAKLAKLLSSYQLDSGNDASIPQTLIDNMRRIQCLTMDPGTVNTKMLLAGWGPCGIPVKKANNTYKLASLEEYSFGRVDSGSYHFGGGGSSDANDEEKLNKFWNTLVDCTGTRYDDLSSDCF
eukprot:CAMPEP_0181095618 /NCGR_PEP_ID=MMETSP1071-20121207/10607_1 /TAXON_ID=35127 /ORGANISM="Thalassiosira sp., Strain NH16" /LENGTH=332 /DNA_ID=CAMNT_0023177995 /DNA_START=21 /DNA_END=1019 /DNA_ORIENTATION=+